MCVLLVLMMMMLFLLLVVVGVVRWKGGTKMDWCTLLFSQSEEHR